MPGQSTRLTVFGLMVDAVTVEVAGLRAEGVRPLLMKGPLLAELYEGAARPYADTDLLVAPDAAAAAERLWARWASPRPSATRTSPTRWPATPGGASGRRGGPAPDAAAVSRAGRGVGRGVRGRADHRAWRRGGRGGGPETTALLAALHPLHHRMEELKPVRDLEAAVAGLPEEIWIAAAGLADRLGAGPAMAAGLRLVPEGQSWPGGWGSPPRSPPSCAARRGREPRGPGHRAPRRRPRDAGPREGAGPCAVAPPTAMRAWYSLARRGRAGLVAAYLLRAARVVSQVPSALGAWREARGAPDRRAPTAAASGWRAQTGTPVRARRRGRAHRRPALGLHALGHHGEVPVPGHVGTALTMAMSPSQVVELLDEGPVELEEVEWQAAQVGQRRLAGTEVVEGGRTPMSLTRVERAMEVSDGRAARSR